MNWVVRIYISWKLHPVNALIRYYSNAAVLQLNLFVQVNMWVNKHDESCALRCTKGKYLLHKPQAFNISLKAGRDLAASKIINQKSSIIKINALDLQKKIFDSTELWMMTGWTTGSHYPPTIAEHTFNRCTDRRKWPKTMSALSITNVVIVVQLNFICVLRYAENSPDWRSGSLISKPLHLTTSNLGYLKPLDCCYYCDFVCSLGISFRFW